ncbi:MAG: maltose alpha-D-glucosyltransferase [Rhodospirillales bacterium]|nr:maltose alpha-D-glucosyltransferase [Rhodospirillales bacterium]
MTADPLWYKDAVFYQLHVKAFFDSDADGVGDFRGLCQKLDYIQHLGVDTLWLLPFYPSPLRDDGYDIADYRSVHPAYGTLRDFRRFVREAHERGLRVLTELVINHTSDIHPWFQRARRAKPGSAARNYYVWSDSDQRYQGTRIIFTDTERSNWAFDPVAQGYYWHRFFSHQPDLNFDNPRVVREVIEAMRFWLDLGVDGLRLDAVPYLCEREGTNNENLPETHAVLKRLRAALDASHPGRFFLAEANQWPEDVLPYFGEGDECHMAFHFPLMPRMFMAIAREDRHPITDIMRQTPEIPDNCQWAIFLRNHDELTLEMVTDRERDYLWTTYAADIRARINVGIRRRLAPLMDNDRRKIELMNSLLLSMPGTPIIYYGDELGMGDNFFLGDRNGVRTPMQWSEDRNGGFSRADPATLYLPPIMDPVYGFHAVNVEAQLRSPSSLLNWMKRLIAVRQSRKTFGRGALRFVYPPNRRILAYLREYEGETILCVANLARSAQGVELMLGEFRGRVPVELTGQSAFPPIGELPYFLTLPGYGFYWFLLASETDAPDWHAEAPPQVEEFVTLVIREGTPGMLTGQSRRALETEVLPRFLRSQRWYADKNAGISSLEISRYADLRMGDGSWYLTMVMVRREDGRMRTYFLPVGVAWDQQGDEMTSGVPSAVVAMVRRGARMGAIYDATVDDDFALAMLEAIREERTVPGSEGSVSFFRTKAIANLTFDVRPAVRRLTAEQSNTSVVIGDQAILKVLRRPEEGINPEIEMGYFLTDIAKYPNTPPLLGAATAVNGTGRPTTIASLHGYVSNQGDAWAWVTHYLERFFDESGLLPADEVRARIEAGAHRDILVFIETMGARTGELHRALSLGGDTDFDPEPVTALDLQSWERRAREQAEGALEAIRTAAFPEAEWLIEHGDRVVRHISETVPSRLDAVKTRLHGDFHLGQVLVVKNDVYIIDFEGEPERPLAERRAKDSPLRDVAGMLRSFNYAAWSTLLRIDTVRPGTIDQILPFARDWEERAARAFLAGYMSAMEGCPSLPADPEAARRLLHLFLIEKACYEIRYEAGNRPNWLPVPVRGVISLMEGEEARADGKVE